MDFSKINFLAVLVGSLIIFVFNAIWFGPKTFYPSWIRAMGREVPTERVEMKSSETFAMFGGTYLGGLIQSATLGVFVTICRLLDPTFGAAQGALAGALLGFGIAAAASLGHRVFGQANFNVFSGYKVWIIEVSADIIGLTLAGLVFGAWV
jgi:hypothetical protein